MKTQLNCLGKACPQPVIETKAKLSEVLPGTLLEVSVDGDTQVQNLLRLAESLGYEASSAAENGHAVVRIKKAENTAEAAPAAQNMAVPLPHSEKICVLVSSDAYGRGNDELGHILIKSFFFALTQQDEKVSHLLFINSGVKLTSEASPVLEDLKKLESGGAEIISCGTCLDFYQLKEKLAIGSIGNMYDIQAIQLQADKLLKI